jgi:hypothetical protein
LITLPLLWAADTSTHGSNRRQPAVLAVLAVWAVLAGLSWPRSTPTSAAPAGWLRARDSRTAGVVHRGRKLNDSGAKARFFHKVAEVHLFKLIKVDRKSDRFTCDIDEAALQRAQMMDGKLLLVTNVADLEPAAIVQR